MHDLELWLHGVLCGSSVRQHQVPRITSTPPHERSLVPPTLAHRRRDDPNLSRRCRLHDPTLGGVSVQHQGLDLLNGLWRARRIDVLYPQACAVAAHVEEDVRAGAG